MAQMEQRERTERANSHPTTTNPDLNLLTLMTPAELRAATDPRSPIGNCDRQTPLVNGQTVDHTVRVNGEDRSYSVHLPAGWDHRSPLPVLYYFNGMRPDGKPEPESFTGLSQEADKRGFAVVYMRGDPHRWQTYDNHQWLFRTGRDENAYLNAVHDQLSAQLPLDQRRQGLAGFSEGGSEAYLLANQNRWVASAQSVEGYTTGYEKPPNHPISEQSIHASGDQIVPFDGTAHYEAEALQGVQRQMDALRLGSEGYLDIPFLLNAGVGQIERTGDNLQSQSETADTYTRAAGITTPPVVTTGNGNTFRTWRSDRGAEVRQIALGEGGHGWAGSQDHSGDIPVIGIPSDKLNASEHVARFLLFHPLVTQ